LGTVVLARPPASGQPTSSSSRNATPSDWKQVEAATRRSGQTQPSDLIRLGPPRKDLQVVLDSIEIKPALALGSWVAFERDGGAATVMGGLDLTENEVEPVMMTLQEGGVHQSAVHNQPVGEPPP